MKVRKLPRAGYSPLTMLAFVAGMVGLALLVPHNPNGLVAFGLGFAGFAGAIIDTLVQFASAVALSTAATGRALVGDVIDLGTPNGPTAMTTSTVFRDIGSGRPVYLVIRVTTSVTSAGAATVSFELSSDAQAAIAVDGSESIHFATAAIPKATLVAGYIVAVIALPMDGGVPYERYLGIVQNVGTAALTAGAFDAYLTLTPPNWKAYSDGV